jgi:hypothetical protein
VNAQEKSGTVEICISNPGTFLPHESSFGSMGREDMSAITGISEFTKDLRIMMCMDLIEKLGGKLWIEVEAGSGARSLFTLRKCEGDI